MATDHERSWGRAAKLMVALAAAVVALAVFNVYLELTVRHVRSDLVNAQADVKVANARIAAAELVRKQQAANEKKTAEIAAAAKCAGQIAGAKLGNQILDQIRGLATDLAGAVTRQEVKDSLNAHASALPHFQPPKCSPTVDPKKKGVP